MPIVPPLWPRPVAPGMQTALVVGSGLGSDLGSDITTERDARIRLQFPWQRGTRPLGGGLAHDERSADRSGNAPGDAASGTWVRVAQPSAGPTGRWRRADRT